MNDIYENCGTYKGDCIILRQTCHEDALQLLACYSDVQAVPLFNHDNCHGDDFHYTTLKQMSEAVAFWQRSYDAKHFVRWSIIMRDSNQVVGTIELFNRNNQGEGILRIDLASDYEQEEILADILHIVEHELAVQFDVNVIRTKAVPSAHVRIYTLYKNGYHKIQKEMFEYPYYYEKKMKF